MRAVAGAAITSGLGLARCANPETLSNLDWLPDSVTTPKVAIASGILLLAGVVSLLLSFSVRGVQWVSKLRSRSLVTIRTMSDDYVLLEMKVSDLPTIYPVYRQVFGADLIPQSTVEEWMGKNPRIAWKIIRIVKKKQSIREEIVGFFELLPLTRSGEAKLRRNEPDTASLTKADIHSATRWSSTRAYYIASVGVMEPESIKRPARRLTERARAEGVVTKMLFETLLKLGARGRIEVYGRPVTEHGLRLAREYGFTQRQPHLQPHRAVWSREFDNDSKVERDRPPPSSNVLIPERG